MTKKTGTLIIGSGVAGAAIASKLLKQDNNASILMLEAGPKVKMKNNPLFQHYVVSGELPYEYCEDLPYPTKDKSGENENKGGTLIPMTGSRLMIYGGSTVHWGGWSFRLKPEDFTLKTKLSQQVSDERLNELDVIDWPISYDDLEPYYCQAETYIGVSGDSEDTSVPRSKGYPFKKFPYTLEDSLAIDAMQKQNISYSHMPIARHGLVNNQDDPTPSFKPCVTTGMCKYCPIGARYVAANYIDDLNDASLHPNFSVEIGMVVEEILMSSKGQASGVKCFNKNSGKNEIIEADRVIVAAGAVESAKLLLRSTSEHWQNGIGNDNGLVGKNLITHPYIIFEAELAENPKKLQPEMAFPTLVSRFYDSEEEQAKGKFIIVNPSSSTGTKLANVMRDGKSASEIDALVSGPTKVQLHVLLEIFSQTTNGLSNSNKLNRIGLKETVVDFNQDSHFDKRVNEIQSHIEELFTAMGATNTRRVTTSWRADHASCMTRMSHSDKSGVVDKNLKVFGVDNLYVCSNASFSSAGAVNPTLTLTSLALRLGDHLNTQAPN